MAREVASESQLRDPANRAKVEQAVSLIQRGKAGIAGRDPALRPYVNALVMKGVRNITQLPEVEQARRVQVAEQRGLIKKDEPQPTMRESNLGPRQQQPRQEQVIATPVPERLRKTQPFYQAPQNSTNLTLRQRLEQTKIFGTPLVKSKQLREEEAKKPLPEDVYTTKQLFQMGMPTAGIRSFFRDLGTGVAATTQIPKALRGEKVNNEGVKKAGKIIGEGALGLFFLGPTTLTRAQIMKQATTPANVKVLGIKESVGKKGAQKTDVIFNVRSGSNQRTGIATTGSASKKAGQVVVTKARTVGVTAQKAAIGNKVVGSKPEVFVSSGGQVSAGSNKLSAFFGKFRVGTSAGKSGTVGTAGIQTTTSKGIALSKSAAASTTGGTAKQIGTIFPKTNPIKVIFDAAPSAAPRTFVSPSLVPIPQATKTATVAAPSIIRASALQSSFSGLQSYATTVTRGLTPTLTGALTPLRNIKITPATQVNVQDLGTKQRAIPTPRQFPTQPTAQTPSTGTGLRITPRTTTTQTQVPVTTTTTVTRTVPVPSITNVPVPTYPKLPPFTFDFDLAAAPVRRKKRRRAAPIFDPTVVAPDFTARSLNITTPKTSIKTAYKSPSLKALGIRGIPR